MAKNLILRQTVFLLILVPSLGRAAEKYFDSDGVKIHYVVEGKGEPLVLIHGFAADIKTNWGLPGILSALAKKYQVIALDCRGHGKSAKPHDAKQYGKAMMEDVIRLLDHLKIKRAHIVGYSMGGGIALEVLMDHPDRVVTATVGGFGISTAQDERGMVEDLAESLEKGKGFAPLIIAITPTGHPKPSLAHIKAVDAVLLAFNDPKALAACMRGFKEETELSTVAIIKKLKKANRPLLALVGENDPFKPGVDELKKQLPETQLSVIKGGDHVSTFMDSDFLKDLLKFLAEHKGTEQEGK
ncbi:MAG: alpha/beta fold hydrolase [Gemmataceae bacterium]